MHPGLPSVHETKRKNAAQASTPRVLTLGSSISFSERLASSERASGRKRGSAFQQLSISWNLERKMAADENLASFAVSVDFVRSQRFTRQNNGGSSSFEL